MKFDRYKWKPSRCKNLKEIYSLVNENNLIGKKVKKINIIGSTELSDAKNIYIQARNVFLNAGYSFDEIMKTEFKAHFDSVMLPCEIGICEPVVIVFEDNTSLEINACESPKEGFFVGINQINKDIVDGLNPSTVDANKLFEEIIDAKFESLRFDTITYSGEDAFSSEERKETVLRLFFSGINDEFILYFANIYSDCWYNIGMGNGHNYNYNHFNTLKKPYKKINDSFKKMPYLEIADGRDSGGYFLISTISNKDPDILQRMIDDCVEDCFCIDDLVINYLFYFLDKYFDANYPYRGTRGNRIDETLEFDNYDVNCYTYGSINKMIDDINYCIDLLRNDYDNQYLNEIKKSFYIGDFVADYDINCEYDENIIFKDNIYVVIDFYERFIDKVKKMMEHNPNDDSICFCGP